MNKVIIFLQNLILIIAWYAYSMFLFDLIKKNELIGGIFTFFMTSIKNQDIAVGVFLIIFLVIPMGIIQMLWGKIFRR